MDIMGEEARLYNIMPSELSCHQKCPLSGLLKKFPNFDDVIELFYRCKLCALERSVLYYDQEALTQHIEHEHVTWPLTNHVTQPHVLSVALLNTVLQTQGSQGQIQFSTPSSVMSFETTTAETSVQATSLGLQESDLTSSEIATTEKLPLLVSSQTTQETANPPVDNEVHKMEFCENDSEMMQQPLDEDNMLDKSNTELLGNTESSPKGNQNQIDSLRSEFDNDLQDTRADSKQEAREEITFDIKLDSSNHKCAVVKCLNRDQLRIYSFPTKTSLKVENVKKDGQSESITSGNANPHIKTNIVRFICEQHVDGASLFPCRSCNKVFTNEQGLAQHTVKRHALWTAEDLQFMCEFCQDTRFESQEALSSHMKICAIRPYNVECISCGRVFKRRMDLIRHEKAGRCTPNGFICNTPSCNKTFNSKRELTMHERTHLDQKPYVCEECGKDFICQAELTRHSKIHTGQGLFRCEKCPRTFNKVYNYNRHLLTHTGDKPFPCKLCEKRFRTKHSLEQHSLCHAHQVPVVSYKCDTCFKVFVNPQTYQKHVDAHKNKPIPQITCDICGKRCYHRSDFLIHYRSHTGERPYECKVCHKSFVSQHVLTKHSVIHSGQKNFCCELCGASFYTSANLKRHLLKHTGEKQFKCNLCNAAYTRQVTLYQHGIRCHGGWVDRKSVGGQEEEGQITMQEANMIYIAQRGKTSGKVMPEEASPSSAQPMQY